MRKKIFIALIGLLAGIGLFISFETINPIYILSISAVMALILLFIDKKLMAFPIALSIGFSLSFYKLDSYRLIDNSDEKLEITITEKRKVDDSYRYFVKVRGANISEKSVIFTEEDFPIGQKYLIDGEIALANKNTNPNLFNYRNYLISKGIGSNIKIKRIYKEGRSSSILLNLRNKFYNYIHSIFENNLNKNSANFVISVVLGENLIQNEDIKDLGLAHILAVSGLHIDLLIGFILYVFSKINLNYRYGYISALTLAFLYGALIGFPYSIVRVLIINLIGFLAFLYQYPEDKIKSLLIAALVILLYNPFAVLNAGFVLSFVATSGVYLIYPKLMKYINKHLLAESIGFTTAIQATLLPFTAYYYGKINFISILANFLIVPVFTLAMYIIFAIIIFYPILSFIMTPFFVIINYLLESMLNLTLMLNSFKFLNIEFIHQNILISIYLYFLILVIVYIKKSNKKLIKNFYIINIVVVMLSLGYEKLNPETSFSMIDIGQGDTFLINDRGDYYLIDVGGPKFDNYDSGEKILVPYLKSIGVRDIKAVFISHEDRDHSGNMEILNKNFNIKNVITSQNNIGSLAKYQPKIIKKNDKIKLKNGYIACVFDGTKGEENAESMGLLINIEGIKILSLGDLPKEYEDTLDIKADILKVSHHGSKTSTSKEFVGKVSPKAALISAGRNNRYGHPTTEVLENLDGIKIYNTQTDGMVKIYFDKDVRIEKYLKGGFFR
ncbi:DNA internalization-related competence protein ComEC/Rec2 [Anaerococcus sp. ENR1011]|uniref:DNA internalization-related competence protein ComEC/Rec2 n=1 Tax=Anaerococcus groningensis TaxID=3115616 RepID=A0ABW9MYW1_9FIRM